MTEFGINLASETHGPEELTEYARRAEDASFDFAVVSDHYHPWIRKQGNSPFVWGTIGAISERTEELELGTAVTCPTMRVHPAIVAQAAATAQVQMDGRFFLGVGTGERLNEHILGDRWPPHSVRLEMLEEAVGVIRDLWSGEMVTHHGDHYTVENAQVFTLPDERPPIHVSGLGPKAAKAAGRIGDGYVATSPKEELVNRFEEGGGAGPKYGGMMVSYAESDEEGVTNAHEWWPNAGLKGGGQELPTPKHFEDTVQNVTEDDIAEAVVTGPDPQPYIDKVQKYVDAGFDHVYFQQTGPNQEAAIEFFQEEVVPEFS
ncbi:TIGR03557 family F420-dependent LLM class oxidoreductase [Halorussus sp. MSC15.2]|uniref:TIGR03557 family F420-dependent LLM class oxidoreductase n=1 Tax=Halorussus sp. MSC15.2 TaxID=2283638 RepID=UPI0013D05254|nr:TIGR03557 family F420-dependent LLM class oxidoreductase [Halorussus sp. MSC15.2]NEU58621.1 TIGR03557 family F420-dependent LLM class oxidoreductase [Halorussus sp. MSC15.2]